VSTATAYHALTKYSRSNLHNHPGLDWSKAPQQFKEVVGAHRVELRAFGKKPDAVDLRSVLARLLYFANGVTGHLVHPGGRQLLRAAPSAGALYPTELYIGVGPGTEGIEPGLYAYDAREEVLTRLWEEDPRPVLGAACGAEEAFSDARACILATGVFWRSAWRYQERGYRRVLLDTGHVLANLSSIAPFDGLTARPHLGFLDDRINGTFFFEPDREAALACIPLVAGDRAPPAHWRSPARRETEIDASKPDLVRDADELTGSATAAVHRASSCPDPAPVDAPAGPPAPDDGAIRIAVGDPDVELPRAIARRRSARAYPGEPVPFEDLKRALSFMLPRFVPHETWEAGLLRADLFVHRVDGLDPGVYRLQGRGDALLPSKLGDFSARLAAACLGQEIAATCAAVLAFHAPARDAVARYGDRAYRYLHLEAGSLGQRLQLAATDMGHQACGIAGFLDDETAALLELPPEDWVLYLVTVGASAR